MDVLARYKNWQYKNTALLIVSLIIFFYFADSEFVKNVVSKIGELGYPGAFLVGILFVSTFTVAPSLVILYYLASFLNPYFVAVLAGLGAVIGDYIIFRFLKNRVYEELKPLFSKVKGSWIGKIFYTPYFIWLLPIVGASIIASPLPDELGISIMGLSKLKTWQFLILAFILNTLGILIVVMLARSVG
ncbi:hypothetical protein A2V71_04405 [Candidatus Berkelbacteria bacterium RBG_13_40_8]|uniref:TVP38/TMEM64 family membrane protein n=1 Tax=Candidatus Berkelbacteria bacterium RBG_13_40_8 TaxID=1797467 RepID=A0A1F5DLX1_9BACT|nr:MAG: hypothetical protein A2V71_04405 [Candidatus Berkelbacteria bacterium RBG_13_40_8]